MLVFNFKLNARADICPAVFPAHIVQSVAYARHGREPFGPERLDLSSSTGLKAEGLMGCPFDPAQGKGSPLYVNPDDMVNILTKILAEEQVLRSRVMAGGVAARDRLKPVCLRQGSPSAKL